MSENVLAAPPYMQFWLPLSMGEAIKVMRGRKGWSAYQLAGQIRKLSGNVVNIATCVDIVKRAEASDPGLAMSELVIVGEALGIGWDLNLQRNAPSAVKDKTNKDE